MWKRDAALLAGFLAAGAALFFIFRISRPEGASAVVRVSGQQYAAYDLGEDRTVEIQGKDGGTNLLEIRGGKASITEASCPDRLCMRQGSVSRQGECIICLPNEVVVEITGTKEELPYDAVAG